MIGPIVFSVSTGALEEDVYYRFHNLAGVMSLVQLHLEILESPDIDPATVIEQSDVRNPYTGEAINYDPVERILSFECGGLDRLCAVKI
jgi:hypothetical protein